jgi:hypothetical protein
MPHLDFRNLFPRHENETNSTVDPPPAKRNRSVGYTALERRWAKSKQTLGYAGWLNIAFVALAVLGGIVCAFYFFNGSDLLLTTTSWSREFLYPDPSGTKRSHIPIPAKALP